MEGKINMLLTTKTTGKGYRKKKILGKFKQEYSNSHGSTGWQLWEEMSSPFLEVFKQRLNDHWWDRQ